VFICLVRRHIARSGGRAVDGAWLIQLLRGLLFRTVGGASDFAGCGIGRVCRHAGSVAGGAGGPVHNAAAVGAARSRGARAVGIGAGRAADAHIRRAARRSGGAVLSAGCGAVDRAVDGATTSTAATTEALIKCRGESADVPPNGSIQ